MKQNSIPDLRNGREEEKDGGGDQRLLEPGDEAYDE